MSFKMCKKKNILHVILSPFISFPVQNLGEKKGIREVHENKKL